MREIIQVIKWCGKLSLLFVVATYLFYVNEEYKFIQLESKWLPYNFFVSIFSGIFASMLVVVLCEVKKYLCLKNEKEDYLFRKSLTLFSYLNVMKVTLERFISDKKLLVDDRLFDEPLHLIQNEMNCIKEVEYATFIAGQNSLTGQIGSFKYQLIQANRILQAGIRLRLLLTKIKEERWQEQIANRCFTTDIHGVSSEDEKVSILFNDIYNDVCSLLNIVDSFVKSLDAQCNGRYKWEEKKEQLNVPPFEQYLDPNSWPKL